MNLCEYGCGQEGKYYFKIVKKWCCSESWNSCPMSRKRRIKIWEDPILKENLSKTMKELWNDSKSKLNSEERNEKISKTMKDLWADPDSIFNSYEYINKRIDLSKGEKNGMYNKRHSVKTKKLIGDSESGEKHHHYGKIGPNSYLWKGDGSVSYWAREIKKTNKECCLCKSTYKLEMHHKDKDTSNNERSNLIILCINCHRFWHWN